MARWARMSRRPTDRKKGKGAWRPPCRLHACNVDEVDLFYTLSGTPIHRVWREPHHARGIEGEDPHPICVGREVASGRSVLVPGCRTFWGEVVAESPEKFHERSQRALGSSAWGLTLTHDLQRAGWMLNGTPTARARWQVHALVRWPSSGHGGGYHGPGAARDYQFVVDVWRHSDPELQPFVEESRSALARLAGTVPLQGETVRERIGMLSARLQ